MASPICPRRWRIFGGRRNLLLGYDRTPDWARLFLGWACLVLDYFAGPEKGPFNLFMFLWSHIIIGEKITSAVVSPAMEPIYLFFPVPGIPALPITQTDWPFFGKHFPQFFCCLRNGMNFLLHLEHSFCNDILKQFLHKPPVLGLALKLLQDIQFIDKLIWINSVA
jgi:hypothetical protein